MTEYVILAKNENGYWSGGDTVKARSATAAIREYLDGDQVVAEAYVAVPARSWRPVSVKVETKTALKFS